MCVYIYTCMYHLDGLRPSWVPRARPCKTSRPAAAHTLARAIECGTSKTVKTIFWPKYVYVYICTYVYIHQYM